MVCIIHTSVKCKYYFVRGPLPNDAVSILARENLRFNILSQLRHHIYGNQFSALRAPVVYVKYNDSIHVCRYFVYAHRCDSIALIWASIQASYFEIFRAKVCRSD